MKSADAPDAAVTILEAGPYVVRSPVTPGLPYGEYRQQLRRDFLYSCAYCTLTETEGGAMGFAIDHYEPQGTPGFDVDAYDNLMYSCNTCNTYKTNVAPPPTARQAGIRFYRPDVDIFSEHFSLAGLRINSTSPIGDFSIIALSLNRQGLRRVRELRARLTECHNYVAEGIRALRRVHIDQIPQNVRGRALSAIKRADTVAGEMVDEMEKLLTQLAASPLADPDPDADADALRRKQEYARLKAIHPANWKVPRKAPQGGTAQHD